MDIVKVISLKKKYVSGKIEVNAINGIDLNIKKGEFLAITGPSGSGKSTLLNIVGGNEFPTEGVVEINKRILSSMNDEELTIFRRRNIGFVFQRFNLIPYLNIYQNIVLPLELDHADIDSEFVKELIDELGLDDQIFKMPDELSEDSNKGLQSPGHWLQDRQLFWPMSRQEALILRIVKK
mgnify:CR=1 FL=1